jgi:putative ABC transport system permease protein
MRRHEIGVRLALGASRRRIVSGIVAEGLIVTVCGAAAGVTGTFALSGALSGLLAGGVTMVDIPSFVIATTSLVATSIVACYLPARRASRIEPQHELR